MLPKWITIIRFSNWAHPNSLDQRARSCCSGRKLFGIMQFKAPNFRKILFVWRTIDIFFEYTHDDRVHLYYKKMINSVELLWPQEFVGRFVQAFIIIGGILSFINQMRNKIINSNELINTSAHTINESSRSLNEPISNSG